MSFMHLLSEIYSYNALCKKQFLNEILTFKKTKKA